jgi:hypothetical protein
MLRRLVILALVLVVLLILGGGVVIYRLDALVRVGIEKAATYALGVETTVGEADLGLVRAELAMRNLVVRNPDGFRAAHFLQLDDASTALSIGSLRQPTVVVPHLTLDGLDMHLEKSGDQANYNVILNNLKRFETTEPAPDAKQFIIRQVKLTRVMVHTNLAPIGGEATMLDVPIDEIVLEDVGSENRGVVLAELTSVIVQAVLVAVVNKGVNLPLDLVKDLTAGLGELSDLEDLTEGAVTVAGEALMEVGKVGEEALKGAGDVGEEVLKGAGEAVKGIGDLLGGQKKGDGK